MPSDWLITRTAFHRGPERDTSTPLPQVGNRHAGLHKAEERDKHRQTNTKRRVKGNPRHTENQWGQVRGGFPNLHGDVSPRRREKHPMTGRGQEICPDFERRRQSGQRDASRDPRRQRHSRNINSWIWGMKTVGQGKTEPAAQSPTHRQRSEEQRK